MINQSFFTSQAILDSLADGVYVTDRERKILFWNKAAEKITGYPASEIIGSTCYDDILCHVDKDNQPLCGKEQCPMHRCIVTGERGTVPIIVYSLSKSGDRIPVHVSVSPLFDDQGEIIGAVEVFRDLRHLVKDLQRAEKIQKNLMDSPTLKDARVRFGVYCVQLEYVGGDFYRIEPLDQDLYAVMVADVMGHGVAAALYTMQIRSLWEQSRPLLAQPAEFIRQMNLNLFTLAEKDNYFATAIYGLYHAGKRQFTYVRAGHCPPLVFHSNRSVQELTRNDLALGFFADTDYQEETLTLQPEDTLLLYTDAAIEQKNQSGRMIGQKGFIDILERIGFDGSPEKMPKILEELLKTGNSLRLEDDLTLLALRIA